MSYYALCMRNVTESLNVQERFIPLIRNRKSQVTIADCDSLKSLRACYLNRNNFELNLKLHVILAFDR